MAANRNLNQINQTTKANKIDILNNTKHPGIGKQNKPITQNKYTNNQQPTTIEHNNQQNQRNSKYI